MATFDSNPFPVGVLREGYRRADLEFHGVDQAVPSYEARVFLNNPGADAHTAKEEDSGYLGSFFVFGKVECWGEEGHCEEPERRKFDRRRNPTRWAKFRVTVPEGRLQRLIARGEGDEMTVNVVAVLPDREDYRQYDPADVVKFRRLSIITYG